MQHRKLSTTLALLATGVGLSAFASSAQAVVVDNDPASLTGNAEVQLTDANLAFDFSNGMIEPRVTGTMAVVNGDDACFHVKMDSYDGTTLLHSKRGTNRCMGNDLLHEFDIDLPEDADPLTDRVVVKVEKDGPQGWTVRDEATIVMNTFSDSATLTGSGIDAGGLGYGGGVPARRRLHRRGRSTTGWRPPRTTATCTSRASPAAAASGPASSTRAAPRSRRSTGRSTARPTWRTTRSTTSSPARRPGS